MVAAGDEALAHQAAEARADLDARAVRLAVGHEPIVAATAVAGKGERRAGRPRGPRPRVREGPRGTAEAARAIAFARGYDRAVMSATPRSLLRDAWSQVGRVTIVPEGDGRDAPWPGALVVATGVAIGAAAWLVARLIAALGAAPAVGGLFAVLVAIVLGAAVVERGLHAASERWLGARWASLVVGAGVLARIVALWSLAPRMWLGALVLGAAAGRWAAVGLQRLGDVGAAGRGRTFVVGAMGWLELGVASAAVVVLAILVAGWVGLALALVVAATAVGLGLGVQTFDRELGGESLAAIAAVVELIVLVGLAAAAPAALSPFTR